MESISIQENALNYYSEYNCTGLEISILLLFSDSGDYQKRNILLYCFYKARNRPLEKQKPVAICTKPACF